ncbi:UDP-N-acetylglucosamine 1-carboxyvinyltransferase [Lachnospiraceae bacterium KM106-2]|nr:UDP-N-acetylglucosamine 1-carboxyvinyltransferase [Lachnospiraceae bacterium KM106-2]
MAYIEIIGGKHLHGEIDIHGSKNAVLPILAASVMNRGITKINYCPKIADVFVMIKILESIGCIVTWEHNSVIIDAANLTSDVVAEKYVSMMRSSIILLGALLGRNKCVTITYPGGCSIGKRPIDLHLKAIKQLDVEIIENGELIFCKSAHLKGTRIHLDFPSVGATENLILASVLAEGETIIENAAMEPEIKELCVFLNMMGANIKGAGESTILINGVKKLQDVEYSLVADRIVMGTYMTALAGTGGDVTLCGRCCLENKSVVTVLRKMGCRVGMGDDYINISMYERPRAIQMIETSPYPGFPTDMQSQFMSVLSIATGTSLLVENIFESRYKNAAELNKMGADIKVIDKIALITGVDQLDGCSVNAYDLRGGAALVIAGLLAQGTTHVNGIEYIKRGYEDICKDLTLLGADVKEVQ